MGSLEPQATWASATPDPGKTNCGGNVRPFVEPRIPRVVQASFSTFQADGIRVHLAQEQGPWCPRRSWQQVLFSCELPTVNNNDHY
jgi:hypothetical protein